MRERIAQICIVVVLIAALMVVAWTPSSPVHAQSAFCDTTVAISVSAAATQTIATAIPGQTVYVCGGIISGDTLATTGQFASGGTNLTGAMRMCDECNIPFGDGTAIMFQGLQGSSLTLAAATGAITGFIRIGQHP